MTEITYVDASMAHRTSIITPQHRHRMAAEQHENALKHHRQAALLHDAGDDQQADIHANIAYSHAVSALETAGRTLQV
jgi:hypothetical protein